MKVYNIAFWRIQNFLSLGTTEIRDTSSSTNFNKIFNLIFISKNSFEKPPAEIH